VSGLTERVARALAPHLWAENVYVSRNFDETGSMAELIEKRRDHIRAQARRALGAVADDVDGLAGVLRVHFVLTTSIAWYCDDNDCDWTFQFGADDEDGADPVVSFARHQAEQLAAYIRDGAS
jgi:hypothetical protein